MLRSDIVRSVANGNSTAIEATEPGGHPTSINLIRTLYAQAPHATLHAPFCTVKPMLEGCQYLVSTDGQRLSAAVAYSEDAIEFAWSLAGRAETLRNLIAQVRHRLKVLSFVPVMETGRRSWGHMLGIPVLGRHFRSYLPDPKPPGGEIPADFEIITLSPENDIEEISRFMNKAYPSLHALTTPKLLLEMAKTNYAFPDGCFALKHLPSGMDVGLAICGFCQEMEEGFICWTQVTPRFRHRGLGELIVRESIRRLCGRSRFITASGSLDAPFSRGDLYKRCGFEHTRQWTILGQRPISGDRPLPFTPRVRNSRL
ncbi:MAG: hypothetical protein KAY24_11320 [Candidatus Eisenbacteria sp.]|nr:hypothetical protein [Candidatus Eisenbacteria bacterium]